MKPNGFRFSVDSDFKRIGRHILQHIILPFGKRVYWYTGRGSCDRAQSHVWKVIRSLIEAFVSEFLTPPDVFGPVESTSKAYTSSLLNYKRPSVSMNDEK